MRESTSMAPHIAAIVLACLTALTAPLAASGQDRTVDSSRVAALSEDLDSARTGFLGRDRSFSPHARTAFAARMVSLRDSAPLLDDDQIITRLATAVATARNGHTRLYLLRNRTSIRRYPVRVWWFGDSLYIVRSAPADSDLVGARVVSIGGQPIAKLAKLVAPLYAANRSWRRYISTYTLLSPEILHGLRVIPAAGAATIVAVAPNGRRLTRALEPLPLVRAGDATEAWWDLSPAHPGRWGPWLDVLPLDTAQLPLYLRNPRRNYWLQYIPANRLLYVNYNRSQEDSSEATSAFADRLFGEIQRTNPAKVVVDLRFNTGGNLDLAEPMIRRLAALPLARERGRLFVITGRATFSAGIYHAALLRELTQAVFVGEPVGDNLDFWSEGGNFVLPNSKLTLHFADRFHSYSRREYPERRPYVRDLSLKSLDPDIAVETSFKQYLAGRDPALDAVIKFRRPH